MRKIAVKTKSGKSVILTRASMEEQLAFLREDFFCQGKRFLITDRLVFSLYKDFIHKNFCDAQLFILPAGESSKSYEQLKEILMAMKKYGLSRTDKLISLGGGVVGDIAGLAAALYMRGIFLLQIPTTLLAMADSSVGGKCAVDFCGVKNLIGAFYPANYVLIDPLFLNTLEKRERISGLGEIVKYAMLDNKLFKKISLFSLEEMLSPLKISTLLYDCISYKAKIVQKDEKDFGKRKCLNLGHTTAHAMELAYGLSHGESVLWGLYFETCLALKKSQNLSWDDKKFDTHSLNQYLSLIKRALSGSDIPDFTEKEWVENVRFDKKNNGRGIAVMLPRGRGKTALYYFDQEYYIAEILRVAKEIKEDRYASNLSC